MLGISGRAVRTSLQRKKRQGDRLPTGEWVIRLAEVEGELDAKRAQLGTLPTPPRTAASAGDGLSAAYERELVGVEARAAEAVIESLRAAVEMERVRSLVEARTGERDQARAEIERLRGQVGRLRRIVAIYNEDRVEPEG